MIKISKIPFPKRQYEIISKSGVNFCFKDKWEFISNLEANRTGAFDVRLLRCRYSPSTRMHRSISQIEQINCNFS